MMNSATGRSRLWTAVFGFLLLSMASACATAPAAVDLFEFENDRVTQELEKWFEGESLESLEKAELAQEAFFLGESLYWKGDLEGAYGVYTEMLRAFPGHPLNRYAAYRIYGLRHDIIDFSTRTAREFEGVRFDEESPLTRLELVRTSHFVARHLWGRELSSAPFQFEHAGAIHHWHTTPRLSPWRLQDFDTIFEAETTDRLASRYRSPQVASSHSANLKHSRVVAIDEPGDRLNLGSSGVYYLEGWVHVDEAQSVTMSGNFPGAAKVWLGGELILEHREEDYEPGRILRDVELEPGSHRVRVKLAYRPNYRDWFELFFLPQSGEVMGDAGIRTSLEPEGDIASSQALSSTFAAIDLEPVQLKTDLGNATSATLYGAALSAHASGEIGRFDMAWTELMRRHPEFAPGYVLAGYQIRTRWDVPSELRDSTSMSHLRRAAALEPENLHILVRLERWLRDQGNDREHRQVLEKARMLAMEADEMPLRQVRPLVSWARHMEQKGWSQDAEEAWRHVLSVDSTNCSAAYQLQGLYIQRQYMPALEEITPDWADCFSLVERWLDAHPDRLEERRDLAALDAKRFPFDVERQRTYSSALRALNEREAAAAVLDDALYRMPLEPSLWEARVDLALLEGDNDYARGLIDQAVDYFGRTSGLDWKRSRLSDELPLRSLMPDGYAAAMEEVRRIGESDEVEETAQEGSMALDDAYYVIDFRGKQYFPDGSSWTLTHRVVRVMTRGAIDRYAELSVPGGAHLLLARTIKEDGEVRVPEDMPGKSTLSMPGLAEGDMVEVAYLQFRRPSEVASHVEGQRFFFQMPTISSRRSEFILLGAEDFDIESANGAPEPEVFEWEGNDAIRFVTADTRRPRSEPRNVNALEYLPWVREYRIGVDGEVLDVERRYFTDALRDSSRMAPVVRERLEEWLKRPIEESSATDEEVEKLYYELVGHFTSSNPAALTTEAAHAVHLRRGSPVVVFHTMLNALGVENDVFMARSDEQPPLRAKVGELARFRQPLMRIRMPQSQETVWIEIDQTDSMFGAIEPEVDGQDALCISCDEYKEEVVSMAADLRPHRHVELTGELDAQGALTGELTYRFEGVRAVRVRSALRNRPDEDDRRSYFERVLTGEISGGDLIRYEVRHERDSDRPLEFVLHFEQPQFARVSEDRLVLDRPLFQEAMQRIYAPLSTRELPMFVGYDRSQSYSMHLRLPEGVAPQLRAQDIEELDVPFANFERRSWLEGQVLRIETTIELPRQRISPEDYGLFRQWATEVEESANLWLAF